MPVQLDTSQAYTPDGLPVAPNSYGADGFPNSGAARKAAANTKRIQSGQDIPSNSPLSETTSGPVARFFERLGLPSTPEALNRERSAFTNRYGADSSIGSRFLTDLTHTPSDLLNTTTSMVSGPVHAAAQYPVDLYNKNYAGAAGDATGVLLAALGARGASRIGSAPVPFEDLGQMQSPAGTRFTPPGTPIYEEVAGSASKPGIVSKALTGLANKATGGKLQALLNMLPDGAVPTVKKLIGYDAGVEANMPPRTAAIQKPPVQNPQGMAFAAPPSGPAIPINQPAAQAYMQNPAAVTTTAQALMNNESLLPSGGWKPGDPVQGPPNATPYAQANAALPASTPPVSIPSPTAGFTPQAFEYLHKLIRNKGQFQEVWDPVTEQFRQPEPAAPTTPATTPSFLKGREKLGQPTSAGGFGFGSKPGPSIPAPKPSELLTYLRMVNQK